MKETIMTKNIYITFFCVWCLLTVTGFEAVSQVNKKASSQQHEINAVNSVERILSDPLMPGYIQNSKLLKINDSEQDASRQNEEYKTLEFIIVPKGARQKDTLNSCNIDLSKDGNFDFMLFLANNDVMEIAGEPNWEKIAPQWDVFVNRFWPGMRRVSDWKNQIAGYKAGRGIFLIEYALERDELLLKTLVLEVRLADGKIGGVNFQDWSGHIAKQSAKHPPPPSPSKETVLRAIIESYTAIKPQALAKFGTPFKNFELIKRQRIYSRSWDNTSQSGRWGWNYEVDVRAVSSRHKNVSIKAIFEERTGKAVVGEIEELPPTLTTDGHIAKPYTFVYDQYPTWSEKDNKIYFETTRDVAKRPWWHRGSRLQSLAIWQGANKLNNDGRELLCLRPIKPLGEDLMSYAQCTLDRSSRMLQTSLPDIDNRMLMLNNEKSLLFIPEQDGNVRTELLKRLPSAAYLPREPDWAISTAMWMPDRRSLVISMKSDFDDRDLYLAHFTEENLPTLKLLPVDTSRSDNYLPKITHDAKTLAFVGKKPNTTNWQFITANIDSVTGKLSNLNSVDLTYPPVSVSWNIKELCWLVVLGSGDITWIKDFKGNLLIDKSKSIKWGEISLKPTSADVSPDGSKIAVAAELSTPQVYEKTECVVHSLIFLWDGKSEQVKPAYEPSLNGIPRYTFPNGSPWAKIVGDVKKFGLEGIADPAYFVTPPTPVKPLQ